MSSDRFWTERSVPGSASWPFFRGRAVSRYRFVAEFVRGKRVLDVACGTGHGSHLLATEGGASEVVGVDVSSEAVAYARENFAADNVRYLTGDSQDLGALGIGRFDLVSSMGTLEHIERPDAFASGVRSLLQPGGVWLVTMLNPETQDERDPYHHQEWSAEEFRRFVDRHFATAELRWHVLLASGVEKRSRMSRRYAFVPRLVKDAVKGVLGRHASLRVASAGAVVCEASDFEWSSDPAGGALEYLAICRTS